MNGKSKFKTFSNIFLFISLFLFFLTIIFAICRCFLFKEYFDNLFNKEEVFDSPYKSELFNYLNDKFDDKEYQIIVLDLESDNNPEVFLLDDDIIKIVYSDGESFFEKDFSKGKLVMLYDYDNLTPTWSIYVFNDTYDFSFTNILDDILEDNTLNNQMVINSYLTYYDFKNNYNFYELDLPYVSFTKDSFSDIWNDVYDDMDVDNYFTTSVNNEALASFASEIKRVESEKEKTSSIVDIAKQTGDFVLVNDYVLKCGEYQGAYIDYVIDSNGERKAALKSVSFTLNKDSSYYYKDDEGNYTVTASTFKLNDSDVTFTAVGNNLFYLTSEDILFSYVG